MLYYITIAAAAAAAVLFPEAANASQGVGEYGADLANRLTPIIQDANTALFAAAPAVTTYATVRARGPVNKATAATVGSTGTAVYAAAYYDGLDGLMRALETAGPDILATITAAHQFSL